MNDLNLTIDYDGNSSKAKELQWIYIFGDKTPEELYKQLAHSDDIFIKISLHDIDREPNAEIRIVDNTNSAFFAIKNVGSSTAELSEARTLDQSNGISKKYLWSLSKTLQEIGTKNLCLTAMQIGGYAWAKYGFLPDSMGWSALQEQIRNRLNENKKQIKFRDENYYLSDAEIIAIDKVLKSNFNDLPVAFPQLTELNRPIDTIDGHKITVGKALLIDTGWQGILPLDENNPSFKRFKAYTAPSQERQQQI